MKNLLLVCLVLLSLSVSSQSFIGVHSSNYDALKGHTFNPGLTPMSHSKWEVNLVGLDMNIGNNYISLNGGLKEYINDFDVDVNVVENLDGTDKNARILTDIHVPSFMFNIPKIGSFTFQNRVRTLVDLNSVSEGMLTSIYNDANNVYNWVEEFEDDELSINVNAYAEIGIGYGRYIINQPKHALSAGVNFKLLVPGYAGSVYGENISFELDTINETLNMNNSHIAMQSSDIVDQIVDDEFSYKFGIKGFGFDAGIAYEYRPKASNQLIDRSGRTPKSSKKKANPNYLLKVGVGFIDFGRVKYQGSTYSRDFQADGSTVVLDDITVDSDSGFIDFDEVLNELGSFKADDSEFSSKLPFAMTLFADLKLTRTLYVNFSSLINMGSFKGDKVKARQLNNFYITPRFEMAQLGVQVPMGYNAINGFEMGTSIRFSNFVIGSTNLFSSLWNKSFEGVNVQFAMAFGGVRKSQLKSEDLITPEVDDNDYYEYEDYSDDKKNKKERKGVGE